MNQAMILLMNQVHFSQSNALRSEKPAHSGYAGGIYVYQDHCMTYYIMLSQSHLINICVAWRRQKSGSFGWYVQQMGGGAQLLVENYHFLLLLLFDLEAFKMCKNTIKFFL